MLYIVIGNVAALISSIVMIRSGYLRKKKDILHMQIVELFWAIVSEIILGGFTGAIINLLSCIRNILCYKGKLNFKAKAIIILLASVLTISFNNLGFIGLVPLFSMIAYVIFMNTKNVIKLKSVIIFSMSMWLIYDICIKSYVSVGFDILYILVNIVSILVIMKKNKMKKCKKVKPIYAHNKNYHRGLYKENEMEEQFNCKKRKISCSI